MFLKLTGITHGWEMIKNPDRTQRDERVEKITKSTIYVNMDRVLTVGQSRRGYTNVLFGETEDSCCIVEVTESPEEILARIQ